VEEYATARDYLTSAINAVPDDAAVTAQPDEAYFLRGNIAYWPEQDYRAAQDDYEEALELSPDDAAALNNLGMVARSQGNYQEATDYYEQALALFRELGDRQGEANSLMGLGMVARSQGNYKEAIDYYEQALDIMREIDDTAGIASISWNLGLLYEAQGDMERAVPLMQASIDFDAAIGHPDAAGDANHLCWNGSLGGVAEEVVDTCEQAVELASDQEKPFHIDSRGLNRALTGDIPGAIEDFQFFVDELQGIEPGDEEMASAIAEVVAPREAWIEALEAGENPFDEETLEELREE
jgi:tetratricopeptide (TPR) repeat protein